jgi:hypothetical protein
VNRLAGLWSLAALVVPAAAADRPDREARFFDARVAPILTRRCLGCHNEQLKNAEISFLDRDSLLRAGSRGPAIVPGKPELSRLVAVLRHDGEIQMPPGPKLPPKEIAILTDWIQRGAVWGTKLRRQSSTPQARTMLPFRFDSNAGVEEYSQTGGSMAGCGWRFLSRRPS